MADAKNPPYRPLLGTSIEEYGNIGQYLPLSQVQKPPVISVMADIRQRCYEQLIDMFKKRPATI